MKMLANTNNIYADNWLILHINIYKEINTFIQQRHIKSIRSDSEDIYNVKKDFYFK